MKILTALAGGLAGAGVLTAIHQIIKSKNGAVAPRMDLLGLESLIKLGRKAHIHLPDSKSMYNITLGADIIANAIYYSAAALGNKHTMAKGAALGLGAGLGAVYLPGPMGLDEKHSNRTSQTKALSVLYYLAGGLVAAGVIKLLDKPEEVQQNRGQ